MAHNNKTINQLLGITSKETPTYDSYVVKRCTQLCNIPISEFEVEDYRVLISQGIALEYIIPPAIGILARNLFAEGDYYEGDLLKSVLTIDNSFWSNNPALKNQLQQSCMDNFKNINEIELSIEIKENLQQLVSTFLNK